LLLVPFDFKRRGAGVRPGRLPDALRIRLGGAKSKKAAVRAFSFTRCFVAYCRGVTTGFAAAPLPPERKRISLLQASLIVSKTPSKPHAEI
jgi:hypothetical protein